MEKLNKNLKITRIVLYILTAVLLLLQLFWNSAIYFAFLTLIIAMLCFAVNELYAFIDLKNNGAYVEKANTKFSSEEKADDVVKEKVQDNNLLSKQKKQKMGYFILFFGIAVVLMTVLIRLLFN